MEIKVNKTDDINYVITGTIANSVVEEKVQKLISEAKEADKEKSSNENIEQQAAAQVFQEFIDAGIKEAGIEVESILGQPGLQKYEKQKDSINFEVDIATSPDIDVNIDISDILPSYTKPKADPEKVEEKLLEFATKQAPFTPIKTPKAVENGDVAVIDFTGYIDGKTFEGGSAEKFNLKIGSKSFISGFEDQIIGMNYGDEKSVIVTFPEQYQAKDLAGKEAEFKVKLHEIQEQIPETINDEFAKKILNNQNATTETLKSKFADQVTTAELSELYIKELKPKIIEGLLKKFSFTLPKNVVEQEIDAKAKLIIQSLPQDKQKETVEDKEKFLNLRNSVRKESEDTIKSALIVEALAIKEGITVDEQEMISALTYQAMMAGQDANELLQYYKENNLMTSVKLALVEDKLFGQMLGFNK